MMNVMDPANKRFIRIGMIKGIAYIVMYNCNNNGVPRMIQVNMAMNFREGLTMSASNPKPMPMGKANTIVTA